jgi:FkbM family methyltransferase
MELKHTLFRQFIGVAGYDFARFERRMKLLDSYSIDTVLDIGANNGEFAQRMRDYLGYKNRVFSFEPLSSAFKELKASAEGDPTWEVFNIALGDTEGTQEMHIAANSQSSSLLEMLPAHLESAPESEYIGTEAIEVKRLDSIFEDLCGTTGNVYMKLDTQGFEASVLRGAENSLQYIDTVQLEMSLVPLYDGEMLYLEMCTWMSKMGYTLVGLETGFSDRDTGQLLQTDGIFHRYGSE